MTDDGREQSSGMSRPKILLNNYYKPLIHLQKGWKSSFFRIPLQAEKESNN